MTTPDADSVFLAQLEAHRRIVHAVAAAHARDAADRDDLAQEIVAQLWQAFPRWDRTRRYSTWMYRIALNTAISWQRRERRRWQRQVPTDLATLEVPAPDPTPVDERLLRLQAFLARQSEADRALLLLYLDGVRQADIAGIMGISETAVSTRIHRLKQRLRAEE